MAEIVNLRQARKRKAREERADGAAGNRAKFGRSKSERIAEALNQARNERQLDAHRRERDDDLR